MIARIINLSPFEPIATVENPSAVGCAGECYGASTKAETAWAIPYGMGQNHSKAPKLTEIPCVASWFDSGAHSFFVR